MPISYTNRKGVTYMLYRGQTRTGNPCYYFGRAGQGQGEPVTELPPGFTISASVNGVVSLVKDHPSLIRPEEVAAVEAAVQQHPEAHRYRVAVKHDRIEIKALPSWPLWEGKQSWVLPLPAPVMHEIHDTQGEQPLPRRSVRHWVTRRE